MSIVGQEHSRRDIAAREIDAAMSKLDQLGGKALAACDLHQQAYVHADYDHSRDRVIVTLDIRNLTIEQAERLIDNLERLIR